MSALSAVASRILLKMQQNEITEYHIYKNIAKRLQRKDPANAEILQNIANEELKHAQIWRTYTHKPLKPKRLKVAWYTILATVLGYTFALKLMERGESSAQQEYALLEAEVPESASIRKDEEEHETALLGMLQEERLQYVGSMVLGMNDALVELTGSLAGFTFALQDTRLIALSGLIIGISATLSMASSEFLAARSEGRTDAFKSCCYTGVAYLVTVALLILPYLLLGTSQYLLALGCMLGIVLCIIAAFTFYISVAKDEKFTPHFITMACISCGVAVISFVVGVLAKGLFGIEV